MESKIIRITANQVTPALRSMFHLNRPTGIRALAVLEGGTQGRILTDNPHHPTWGLVWEADDGILYRVGNYDRQVLSEAVSMLRQDGLVALGFREADPSVELFPPEPSAGAECLEFDRSIGSSDLSPFLDELPARFTLHRMDRALLERSPRVDDHIHRYLSIENFLTRGIVVCILHGNETVCEAHADMEILGRRELGITTQKAYRRQGFATIACAHLIRLCEEAGSQTYWDCARLNIGSVMLVHKLGFQNERAYKLLAWFKPEE